MAKRGPKPKAKTIPKRGRKIGSQVYERQDWNAELNNDEQIREYDNSRFYEIAKGYLREYKISVNHAVRLAVQIEYANLKNVIDVFGPLKILDTAGKYNFLTKQEIKERKRALTENVFVSDLNRKKGWSPENVAPVTISCGLPIPVEPWINSNDPVVRRIAARIYRENKAKSKR